MVRNYKIPTEKKNDTQAPQIKFSLMSWAYLYIKKLKHQKRSRNKMIHQNVWNR